MDKSKSDSLSYRLTYSKLLLILSSCQLSLAGHYGRILTSVKILQNKLSSVDKMFIIWKTRKI